MQLSVRGKASSSVSKAWVGSWRVEWRSGPQSGWFPEIAHSPLENPVCTEYSVKFGEGTMKFNSARRWVGGGNLVQVVVRLGEFGTFNFMRQGDKEGVGRVARDRYPATWSPSGKAWRDVICFFLLSREGVEKHA